jgi:hypothetical protein
METKQQILTDLREIFARWEDLLSRLSDENFTQPLTPSDWTVKDVVAHMWSWQQASVSRMDAAVRNQEPDYPEWWKIFAPDPEEDVDRTNAWFYEQNRNKTWQRVYADWKGQFLHYMELIEQVPEKDLFEVGRFKWMGTYPLAASPIGSWDHHREHYDPVVNWMRDHGLISAEK